jgi:hypothetical protein
LGPPADPDEVLTDVAFPGTGSGRHAALLVLEQVADAAREPTRHTDVADRVLAHGGVTWTARSRLWWPSTAAASRRAYDDVSIAQHVVEVLTESGLLRHSDDGFEVHAAAARYVARTSYGEGLL